MKVFTQALGLATIYKKCGLVPDENSLDAEMGGSAMLMNSLGQWIDKSMRERQVLSGLSPHTLHLSGGKPCTRVVRYRALPRPATRSAARVCEALRHWVVEE